jgi:hypothetical protein
MQMNVHGIPSLGKNGPLLACGKSPEMNRRITSITEARISPVKCSKHFSPLGDLNLRYDGLSIT